MRWPRGRAALLRTAGVAAVTEGQVSTLCAYASCADDWASVLTGPGWVGSSVASLTDAPQRALEHPVRSASLCGMPDGPRGCTPWCDVVRSDVPKVA
jgi:hypothetical protein